MHTIIKIMAGLMVLSAAVARGAFLPPTEEQLGLAANEPAKVAVLVKDASVKEAAAVARDVITRIVKCGLPPVARDERIKGVVAQVFMALPGQSTALAAALGSAVASSPTASMSPAIVSSIQQAVVAAVTGSGTSSNPAAGAAAGTAFGNSYAMASQSVAGAPAPGKAAPPTPPPPPVALKIDPHGASIPAPPAGQRYEGQNLP